MKIRAICLVKNEADIIAQSLAAASEWADRIYVLDNGSGDGTWEIVTETSLKNPVVVPFRQDASPFRDSLRNDVFRHYRREARSGDWWCILDADEFFVENPREFLDEVPPECQALWFTLYNFQFTDVDLAAYEADPGHFSGSRSWQEVLHHYVVDTYSEYRFVRHWWGLERLPPRNWGPVHPKRIRIRHYRYRSPEQIMRRLTDRLPLTQRGEFFHERREHWRSEAASDQSVDWRERLVPSSICSFDSGDDSLADSLPWEPVDFVIGPNAARLILDRFKKLGGRIARRALQASRLR